MRVDENALPRDQSFKVRCPSCKGIGTIGDTPDRETKSGGELHGEDSSGGSAGRLNKAALHAPAALEAAFEPSIPDDAFQDFRFPAERLNGKEEAGPRSRNKPRLLILALISLAVVSFFALLVNLVLPGPSERSIYKGAIPPDNGTVQSAPTVPRPGR